MNILDSINKIIYRIPILSSLIINTLLFALTYALFYSSFQTVDDVGILMRPMGLGRVIEPTAYLLHSNIILGYLFKSLYNYNINIPWYGYYNVFFLFCFHLSFLYILLKKNRNLLIFLLYIVYFLLFGIFILLNFQFTILSCLTAFAGIALIVFMPSSTDSTSENEETAEDKPEATFTISALLQPATFIKNVFSSLKQLKVKELFSLPYIAGILLIVCSALIRWWALQLAIVLFVPFLVLHFYNQPFSVIIKQLLLLGVAFFLSFGVYQYDRINYTQDVGGYENWHNFRATYKKVYDYKLLKYINPTERERILNKVGFTDNDGTMLTNNSYLKPSLFTIDRGQKLMKEINSSSERNYYSFTTATQSLLKIFTHRKGINCLIIIALVFLLIRQTPINILRLLSLFAIVLFFCYYLIYFKKPPQDRIIFPMMTFICVGAMLMLSTKNAIALSSFKPKSKLLFSCFVLLLLIPQTYLTAQEYIYESKENMVKHRWLETAITDLPEEYDTYVTWGQAIPLEFLNPFVSPVFFKDIGLFHLGADQLSPAAQQILADDIDLEDFYLEIVEQELPVIIRPHNRIKLYAYVQFMEDHYDMTIRPKVLKNLNVFTIYQFEEVENE